MKSEMKKGLMVVISGPAGSGKGTVVKELLPDGNFAYSVSATTRAPRPGEINDINYHFITKYILLTIRFNILTPMLIFQIHIDRLKNNVIVG